jgi:hypothetical protein
MRHSVTDIPTSGQAPWGAFKKPKLVYRNRCDIGSVQRRIDATHFRKRHDATRMLAPARLAECCGLSGNYSP